MHLGEDNLVPRELFPGFGGFSRPTSKAREKRPGDEVGVKRDKVE